MDWLEPWWWQGWWVATLSAWCCALVGIPLYLRRMSLMADALAHAVLPGVVLAWWWSGHAGLWVVLPGAVASGVVTVLLVQRLVARDGVREDAAIGMVFTSLFALGVVLLAVLGREVHLDLHCVLFGDVLGVSEASRWFLLGLLVVLLVWFRGVWRPLMGSVFDPLFAVAVGVPVMWVQQGTLVMTSLTIALSLEAVGVVLVLAVVVLPAAFGHRMARTLRGMVIWAMGLATWMSTAGMVSASLLDIAPAGAMVLAGALPWFVAVAWSGWVRDIDGSASLVVPAPLEERR